MKKKEASQFLEVYVKVKFVLQEPHQVIHDVSRRWKKITLQDICHVKRDTKIL